MSLSEWEKKTRAMGYAWLDHLERFPTKEAERCPAYLPGRCFLCGEICLVAVRRGRAGAAKGAILPPGTAWPTCHMTPRCEGVILPPEALYGP